jgi:hypothetical protein
MADEEEAKPFAVKDRRRFSADGESQDAPETPAEPAAADGARSAAAGAATAELPPLEFATLLLSLASSVVYHLGEVPHPETGRAEKNLPLARQTIDLLGILQQKTRGNLSEDEAGLLESLLYDLRIKYVQAVR